MPEYSPVNVLVVGNGRFGSYFARLLTEHGVGEVCTIDLTSTTDEIDLAFDRAGVVVFAVPMRDFAATVQEHAKRVQDDATVIDVCSVKVFPSQIMAKAFHKRPVSVVASHPLFGPQSAPGPDVSGNRIAACHVQGDSMVAINIFRRLKLSIFWTSPEAHDRQMASQVIDHFIGRGLIQAGIERVELSTKTHELLMTVVDIVNGNDPNLFPDMNVYNPFAAPARRKVLDQLEVLDSWLCGLEDAHV